jgi:16S rRNA (cytosine967-C5)-methyltransferase
VLVDTPCSGLGTLRRHPDLKWRATSESRTALGSLQLDLLRSAIRVCKNGGLIVYSVCTFTREETVDIARTILASSEVTTEDGVSWLDQWKISNGQYRVLPEKEGLDGFFLMRLRKGS